MRLECDKYRIQRSKVLGEIEGLAVASVNGKDVITKEQCIERFEMILEKFKEYDRLSRLYVKGLENS
ncbi:MAG: hypothetical protein ACLQF0_08705 [Dissulfurispiraceae bacterium]